MLYNVYMQENFNTLVHKGVPPGAYPGGRTPGGPSESLILAPSELKNVTLTLPLPPPR